MPSFWARIVTLFSWVSFSPSDNIGSSQITLPVHVRPNGDQRIPIGSDGFEKGPTFTPPDLSPAWRDFECDYTAMKGYKFCSTEGDRSCWLKDVAGNGAHDYNINTNYEDENIAPVGTLRKYYIEITNTTIAPDGVNRIASLVNGSYPGPWIQACWGDEVEITVNNTLDTQGTTIHWHGIRMLNTNLHDGVNAITQCPIAPKQIFKYKFRALQFGTTWYHSHYSLQYGEGVVGPLTIHGPSSSDYDEAKYPVMMSDWAHVSFFKKWHDEVALNDSNARSLDNILLNGTGTFNGKTPNEKYTLHFTKGRRYLLRLINTSVDSTFVFSIDNHKIQVIGADLVPIVPYMTDHVVVGIGQRYHIVVTANTIDGAEGGSYWIRTELADGCDVGRLANKVETRSGYVRYGDDMSNPKDLRGKFSLKCRDEPYDKLVPILPWQVGKPDNVAADSQFDISRDRYKGDPFWPNNWTISKWNMYYDTMWLNFSNPTVAQVPWGGDKTAMDKFNPNLVNRYSAAVKVNTTAITDRDAWMYMLVSGTGVPRNDRTYVPANHPIHLHGHDFAILQQSTEKYQLGNLNLKLNNPPRRDVAFMPNNGYLVLAFKADNPGVWLMHCHIAWHASGGLALQIVENVEKIKVKDVDMLQMQDTCAKWTDWAKKNKQHHHQDDSGI